MSPTVTGGLEGVGTEEAVRRESGRGGTVGLVVMRGVNSGGLEGVKNNRRSCCDGDREVRSGAGDDSEADPDRGFGDRGLEGDRAPARSEMVTGGTGGLEGADRGRSRPSCSPAEQIEAPIKAEMDTGGTGGADRSRDGHRRSLVSRY